LGRDGKLSPSAVYVNWWFEVTSTRTDGVVEMKSLTHKNTEGTLMENAGNRAMIQQPRSPILIAGLIGLPNPETKAAELKLKAPSI
jgi:hypothetical protein